MVLWLLEKCENLLHCKPLFSVGKMLVQKILTFFQRKITAYLTMKSAFTLRVDVLTTLLSLQCFEQLAPDWLICVFAGCKAQVNGIVMQPFLSLREHLCTLETFTVDQILRDFLRNYH